MKAVLSRMNSFYKILWMSELGSPVMIIKAMNIKTDEIRYFDLDLDDVNFKHWLLLEYEK